MNATAAWKYLETLISAGVPVLVNRDFAWGQVAVSSRDGLMVIYVDSFEDFQRRFRWALRPLLPAPKSADPAVAIP